MEKYYTTGELARLCHVTKRTVQYYDKENIVKPSRISEGGRRNYTENYLNQFKLVCLYKNLGLSLNEIKDIIESDNQYELIVDLLTQQQNKIDRQIMNLTELKEKLTIIYNEVSTHKRISVQNEDELNDLIFKKTYHQKTDKTIYLLLLFYVIILFLSLIVGSLLGGWYMYFIIGMNILLLCGLIELHSIHNAYVCPYCHKKFKIGFLKDMLTLHNGKKGKYLKCPHCHQRNWIVETFTDDE